MRTRRIARIVSGGQSGVDRAALDAAIGAGLPYGGWCPAGGWAEDLPEPPGLLGAYPLLRETGTTDPEERTRLNVRDSDLVLVIRDRACRSPGTDLTARVATALGRPLLETRAGLGETGVEDVREEDVGRVVDWLLAHPPGVVVDVAGPRESERPGAYLDALDLLRRVIARLDDASPSLRPER